MFFVDIWAPINSTMCYQDVVCEDECCHDLEFGIPYCCSRYAGFIYLGLMMGGGVIIAILVIACYVFMRRTERELEAAAKLEAAKAVNSSCSTNSLDTSLTDQNNLTNQPAQHPGANPLPPAYHDVMRTFTRCQSCDIPMTTAAQSVEIMNALVRQYSEGSQAPLRGLPVLVDIQELIARHRREHGGHRQIAETGLLPVNSQDVLQNKLPTYEECTSRNMEVDCGHRECSRENERESGDSKSSCNVMSTLGSSFDYGCHRRTRHDVEHRNKMVGESNVYFENVSETFLNAIREDSVTNRHVCAQIGEGAEGEEREEVIGNAERREWAQEQEPRVVENRERREWAQEQEPRGVENRERREWAQEQEPRGVENRERREWAEEEERRVVENREKREWVQDDEQLVIVNTGRREYVPETEARVILNTGRREYVPEAEARVILNTGRREYVPETEARVILNTGRRGCPQEEEEPRVVVETEIRECVADAELHVILNTEIRDLVQAAEPRKMKTKEETITHVGEHDAIVGISNLEARDWMENMEGKEAIANTEITTGCWINRTTCGNANEGTGNREIEEEIVVVGFRERAENTEGGMCARYTHTGTRIEVVETGRGIQNNRLKEYVGEQVNIADTIQGGGKIETMGHTSDIGTRECVTGRKIGVAVEGKEMQHDTEDGGIIDMIVSAEIMECPSDTEVRVQVGNSQTKGEIDGIGNEMIPNIREENQHTVTRETIEDVKIREGITDTEKREGIGDTGTIQGCRTVNSTTREQGASVGTIDKAEDREPKNTTASVHTGEQMVEKEITGIVNSDSMQSKELINRTEGTGREELINDAEPKQGQLETQFTQEIVHSESGKEIEVTERIKSMAGTTRKKTITDKERREDVSKI